MNLLVDLKISDLKNKSGIYKIYCNTKFYIGSSKSLYSRLREHKIKLLKNTHSNDYLQRTCNKYGIEHFYYEIIEFCEPDKRILREKYYIDLLKPEFNLQTDPILKTLSNYSKQKLSNSVKKGRSLGKYKTSYDYIEIEEYNFFGNYIKSYKNKEEASKKLNLSKKEIQRLTSGYKKGLNKKGVRLRYKNSKVPVQEFKLDSKNLGKSFSFYKKTKSGDVKAFKGLKDCWKFFSECVSNGETEIIIKIKRKTT